MNRLSLILGGALLFCSLSASAQQAAPQASHTLSFQGVITASNGKAVDGNRSVVIRLYSDATGEREVWRDTYDAHLTNGVFSIDLGSGKPLPTADVMGQQLYAGIQIDRDPEMRPLAPLSAAPFALSIADKSVTKEKMATEYVSSLSINGQKLSGIGKEVNIETGDGIQATIDPATNSLMLKSGMKSIDGAKGGGVQGNTTISGSLIVTGAGSFGSSMVVSGLTANRPVRTNGSKQLVSGAIDLTSSNDVTGDLPVSNLDGGTNASSSTYWRGDGSWAAVDGLPSQGGHSGKYLTTNGTSASWANTGLTNFTESVNISAPNDGDVPVVQLLATNAATDVDIALTPKGAGALTAQVADNGTTGGNKRGQYAVDWQMARGSSTQVASVDYSIIGGGKNNTANAIYATVIGGHDNIASAEGALVGGAYNSATEVFAIVAGGGANQASGIESTVGGGYLNTASGLQSVVAGGRENSASGDGAVIAGGGNDGSTFIGNTASGDASFVAGGISNTAVGTYSTVGGGDYNTASGYTSTVTGGYSNTASGQFSVAGGRTDVASGHYSTVSGGQFNTASGNSGTIAGGADNTASGVGSSVSGGIFNVASGNYSAIVGGERLTLSGTDAFGFYSASNATVGRNMSVSANNTGVFGNVDLWLANNDNSARALYFYAPWNTNGAFPSTDKYVGFKAGAVSTSVIWTLPVADGSSGQVLKTDGSGALSWVTAGGLTNFTESANTSAPNATVPVVQLLATNAATDVDVALTPKGFGALTAQAANNLASGGNKRGLSAVDWQMYRNTNSWVASGDFSTISGGANNTASGTDATVSGGIANIAAGNQSSIGGGRLNVVNGSFSVIPGGSGLTLSQSGSFGFLGGNTGSNDMTIAAANTATFGNTDLWLANNDNSARALYFYAPWNTNGAFPSTDKYVGFKAGAVSTSVIWTLPVADGSSGQVLKTDGSGTLSWVTAGGLTNFTESVNTSAPNDAGVPVVQLLATNAATNVDVALTPKGSGALTAQVADGSATGGNKRGQYAVDWQMGRASASQVASANYSAVLGGYGNTASGVGSVVVGGGRDGVTVSSNQAIGKISVIAGGMGNTANADGSAIGGGQGNSTVASPMPYTFETIAGGQYNTASGSDYGFSSIGGGYSNYAHGDYATVGGGNDNTAGSDYVTVAGGGSNSAIGFISTISGGYSNTATAQYSTISGGYSNATSGNFSSVDGGADALASQYGQAARASGSFTAQGDAQTSVLTARNSTSNATPTNLFLDGSLRNIAIASGKAMTFKVMIVGKTNGTGPSVGAWEISGVAYYDGTTTAIAGTNVTTAYSAPGAWGTPTVTASGGNLVVQVTGAAATNIRWVARVETAEVTY